MALDDNKDVKGCLNKFANGMQLLGIVGLLTC